MMKCFSGHWIMLITLTVKPRWLGDGCCRVGRSKRWVGNWFARNVS